MKYFAVAIVLTLFFAGCKNQQHHVPIKEKLQALAKQFAVAEKNDDIRGILANYDSQAIVMPEYELTLQGIGKIETFYTAIFSRQHIKTLTREVNEVIDLGGTVVEIGTLKKEYTSDSDTMLTLHGTYWHVWNIDKDGNLKLKGEAYGFFHPVEHPEALIIHSSQRQPDESEILKTKDIPIELKAYNALMEKGVRTRDGVLRASFFTEDGSFKPFTASIVSGMDKIKPYLLEYSSRGVITIDSIMVYTLDYEDLGSYILEYDMFKVQWTNPQMSGRTEGKGIRLWKRQPDNSLRIYREIGTHNHTTNL